MRRPLSPRSSRKLLSFTPSFDRLDDRICPSVTATNTNGTLTLTGTSASDTVELRAVGTNSYRAIFNNTAGNTTTQTYTAVTTVVANLGDGANKFLFDPTQDANVTLNFTSGTGNDTVRVATTGAVGTTTHTTDRLQLNINTGAGDDGFTFRATGVQQSGRLDLALTTGAGNDRAAIILGGLSTDQGGGVNNTGIANVTADLGDGSNRLGLSARGGVGQTGSLTATITGSAAGTSAGNNVHVDLGTVGTSTSGSTTLSTAKATVNTTLSGGNNFIRTTLAAVQQSAVVSMNVTTGDGSDQVGFNLAGTLASPSQFTLTVNTGAGDDNFGLATLASSNTSATASTGTVRLTLDGGAGTDSATFQLGQGEDSRFTIDGSNFETFTGATNDSAPTTTDGTNTGGTTTGGTNTGGTNAGGTTSGTNTNSGTTGTNSGTTSGTNTGSNGTNTGSTGGTNSGNTGSTGGTNTGNTGNSGGTTTGDTGGTNTGSTGSNGGTTTGSSTGTGGTGSSGTGTNGGTTTTPAGG